MPLTLCRVRNDHNLNRDCTNMLRAAKMKIRMCRTSMKFVMPRMIARTPDKIPTLDSHSGQPDDVLQTFDIVLHQSTLE